MKQNPTRGVRGNFNYFKINNYIGTVKHTVIAIHWPSINTIVHKIDKYIYTKQTFN